MFDNIRNCLRVAFAWLLLASTLLGELPDPVLYNRDVRPILSENCFFCHGFDKENRRAGLRLDTYEGATADLGEYAAIVSSDANGSELINRIFSHDPDLRMPPTESAYSLTPQQRKTLVRWIEQGAEYQEHWSYCKLRRPKVPDSDANLSAIDAFLERGWASNQVIPVREAAPRELLRRLSYHLRGLPPTFEEVREFESDPSMQRYQRYVQRWINSLEYAEHQAVRWLDLVRWSDTVGMVSDEPIATGAYRAYVIDAFRNNMRFDQFTLEQLAGDLLADPSDQTLIASGYNRLVKTNSEAGVINKEALYALKGEHVRAVGTVWLGATTGCCECHDHKYDPLLAKDYYSLAAFFDDLVETGVYTPGDRRVPLHYVYEQADQTEHDAELEGKAAEVYQAIHRESDALDAGQTEWEQRVISQLDDKETRQEFLWYPAKPLGSRIAMGNFLQTPHSEREARVATVDSGSFQRHTIAESMSGFVSERHLRSNEDSLFVDVYLDPENPPELLTVQILHGAYGRMGWNADHDETYYWGDDQHSLLMESSDWLNARYTKRIGDLPEVGGWVRLRVPKQHLFRVGFHEFAGMSWGQLGGKVAWGDSGFELRSDQATALQLAETAVRKWSEQPYNRLAFENRMKLIADALLKPSDERTPLDVELIHEAYREQTQPELLAQLRDLESDLYRLRTQSMPVLVSRAGKPKQTRVLSRGNFMDDKGPIAEPAIPEFLGVLDTGSRRATRLDLARWLVSADNPLTPRVFVNRLWHQFYGRGLSETLEDSGGQGDWPSHPELLDWLAAEFRDSGWDYNHMVRLLVSTRAYRLSSKPSAELARRDPSNRWHARQSRHRHTAEEIRDSALQAGGLLRLTKNIPSSSFFPYQPQKYWEVSSKIMWGSRHMDWDTSVGDQQYQRTLYTFWKRQNIHPTLLAFDAPTRQECTARRNLTNTPGQALVLLNDPIFVEAARGLAERVLHHEGLPDDDAKLNYAVHRVLQRDPKAKEITLLRNLLTAERKHFQADPKAAQSLIAVGQYNNISRVDPIELAAWMAVARSLLNLHEFLTLS